MVLRKIMEIALSDMDIVISWLLIGAIFFARRRSRQVHKDIKTREYTI